MTSAPLRLALVGFGKIARDQHGPALAAQGSFELVALVDPRDAPSETPTFPTLEALFASGLALDAVSICTPPTPRHDLARAALVAGKHVMLEKPPGVTLGEVETLARLAAARGLSLQTAWHARHAAAVEPAREWLAGCSVRRVQVNWKEDVRVWHPGQDWIWQPGGFGVFDSGINALSILTRMLPQPFFLTGATLHVPANLQSPAQASLTFTDVAGTPIAAEFDFLQTGPQTWDIIVETDGPTLRLSDGGARMWIDGALAHEGPDFEYRRLYADFARLIATGTSDVDLSPLQHVADAFLLGRRVPMDPFSW